MVYKVETCKDINLVKEQIEEKAKDVGFSILNIYELTRMMHEKGYPVEKDITVFELCNPQGAQQSLARIAEISAYLPSRISVYEENGVTTLVTIGLEEIIDAVDVNEEFKAYMSILFNNLKHIMHSWD